MNEFFHAAFSFPTAVFSVPLVVVLLYWITVILGAADLDVLDGAFDIDGGFDADVDADLDADADGSGSSILAFLGLTGVPLTVSLSLLIFFGWFLTYTGVEYFGQLELGFFSGTVLATAILIVATALSFVLTAAAATRLRPAFIIQGAMGRQELVNKVCTVTTQRVDPSFGQAEVFDNDGASLVIQVRNDAGAAFKRGQKALIYRYQRDKEIFWISPLDPEIE